MHDACMMRDVIEDWLEKLAKQKGFKSLRALALHVHPGGKYKPGPAGLANKIRDANKRKDLGWWTDKKRERVLHALADALELDTDELVARMQEQSSASPASGVAQWRFEMFPALRALDLRLEPAFPGVPSELLQSGGPKQPKVWWVAPAGAGKTLVGRILELRHGWVYLQASSWKEVPTPLEGKVFIELESTADLSVEILEKLPADVKVCIASPLPPPGKREPPGQPGEAPPPAKPPKDFQILVTPHLNQWAMELITWVEARIRPGGGFNGAEVRKILERYGLFQTPGELLGFLGMVEEVGTEPLLRGSRTRGPSRWIQEWLKAALERRDRRRPADVADLLRKRGAEVLISMEIERRRRDIGGWAGALPRATWINLVPRQIAPEIDRERLLSVLDGGGEAALRQALAPDGASIVSGLEAIGALVHVANGTLMLGPGWVWGAARNSAEMHLANDIPDGLGTLLLNPASALYACVQLLRDAEEGKFERIHGCLKEPPTSPEQMVAVDAAFRMLGIAIVDGSPVPLETARLAWDRQMAHVAHRYSNWPPIPIVAVATPSPRSRDLTNIGTWFFAAFHLARLLVDRGVKLAPSALNPWSGDLDPGERSACGAALSAAASALGDHDQQGQRVEHPLVPALQRLGGEVLDRCGVLDQALSEAQGPDALALLAQGTLKLPAGHHFLDLLLRLPWGLAAVEGACQRRGVPLDSVLKWSWARWQKPNIWQWPPWQWLQSTPEDQQDAKRLWAAAPVSELPAQLIEEIGVKSEAWPCLTEAFWSRWLEIWSSKRNRLVDSENAFQAIPEPLALRALRDGSIDPWCHEVRSILWRRMPDALLALIDELAGAPPKPYPKPPLSQPIIDLVYAAPSTQAQVLVDRARAWTTDPARYPGVGDWLQRWLMQSIEQRGPGWRDAFDILVKAKAAAST